MTPEEVRDSQNAGTHGLIAQEEAARVKKEASDAKKAEKAERKA
jgi:hypothetical protein